MNSYYLKENQIIYNIRSCRQSYELYVSKWGDDLLEP